jgi:hypothetical protein
MSFSGSKGNAALGDTAKGGSGGQVLIAVLIAWTIQTMVLIISLSPSVSCIAPSVRTGMFLGSE